MINIVNHELGSILEGKFRRTNEVYSLTLVQRLEF